MDLKKRPKNFKEIKQGFLHFREPAPSNENVPSTA